MAAMADANSVGVHDRTRIHVDQKHELMFWTKKLGIDEETLKAAVQAAGPTVGAVRRHLGNQPPHVK